MVAVWIGAHAFDNADTDDHDTEGVRALLEAIEALTPPDWHLDALCSEPDYPLEWWFPERGQSTAPAKDVCSRCIVADACDAWADAQGADLVGIWAGVSSRKRRSRNLGNVA